MEFLRIFYNICETDFLRIIVAIDRVCLIIAPMTPTAFLKCLHCLCINLVRIFVPQIAHDFRKNFSCPPFKLRLYPFFLCRALDGNLLLFLHVSILALIMHQMLFWRLKNWPYSRVCYNCRHHEGLNLTGEAKLDRVRTKIDHLWS